MKKLLAIAALAAASLSASAQVYVGGSVGYWHDATEKTNSFVLRPEIGYEVNEKWSFGTTVGYTYADAEGFSADLFEFSPYARYNYFRTDDGRLNLFVDGQVGIGVGSADYDGSDSSETAVYWNVGFRPGVSLNISEHFSFVAKFGFLGYQGADKNSELIGIHEGGGFDFSTQELSFGFHYTF